METTRSPRFLGTPTLHLPCSQTPAGPSMSGHYNMSVLPPPLRQQRLPQLVRFRGSMTRLLQSLSTLRRLGHPSATQDSLLAADHALPGGIGYPQGYSKRFQEILHFILLFQAYPGATQTYTQKEYSAAMRAFYTHACPEDGDYIAYSFRKALSLV